MFDRDPAKAIGYVCKHAGSAVGADRARSGRGNGQDNVRGIDAGFRQPRTDQGIGLADGLLDDVDGIGRQFAF